ncbi:hypothetical protein PFISCL1PPCAC_27315, partial [Pristionchus fissidentatus]
ASYMFAMSHSSLSMYIRVAKVFVDFGRSACTAEFKRNAAFWGMEKARSGDMRIDHVQFHIGNQNNKEEEKPIKEEKEEVKDIEEVLVPEVKEELEPIEIMREDLIEDCKPEVIEEKLNVEPQIEIVLDASSLVLEKHWNGKGNDYITRKMKSRFVSKGWKYDDNGDNNTELLPHILNSQNLSDPKKIDKMKAIVQYVVNDRHANEKERLYLRPMLIHHFCNGFALDQLRRWYGTRVPCTANQIEEYCSLIEKIYLNAGNIMEELFADFLHAEKLIDSDEKEDEKEVEKLIASMLDDYPVIGGRKVPPNAENLSEEMIKRRQTVCDLFMNYALICLSKLQELGIILTDTVLDSIVQITVYNIPISICSNETGRNWATIYIKKVMSRFSTTPPLIESNNGKKIA